MANRFRAQQRQNSSLKPATRASYFLGIGEVQGAGTTLKKQSYRYPPYPVRASTTTASRRWILMVRLVLQDCGHVIMGNNDIAAYPNPAKDKVYVQHDRSKGPRRGVSPGRLGPPHRSHHQWQQRILSRSICPMNFLLEADRLKIERSGRSAKPGGKLVKE